MFRTSIGISLMTAAALVVFIIAAAGPASATCMSVYNRCMDGCDRLPPGGDGSQRAICKGHCSNRYARCTGILNESGASSFQPTNPTGTPPKGGLKPITGGGIKDPGGGSGSPTKPIRTTKPVDLGGIKESGDGSGSGNATIYRSHVGSRKH